MSLSIDIPELLTPKEAADLLKASLGTVYALCARGELPHLRIGRGRGTIRIKAEDLRAYIDNQRVKPSNLDHLMACRRLGLDRYAGGRRRLPPLS